MIHLRWIRLVYGLGLLWEMSIHIRLLSHISCISAFSSTPSISFRSRSTVLFQQHRSMSSSSFSRRRDIQLPLLDFSSYYEIDCKGDKAKQDKDSSPKSHIPTIPLPCSHLPSELCTILYTQVLNIQAPAHKMLMEQVWSESAMMDYQKQPLYGHIVHRGTGTPPSPRDVDIKKEEEYSDFYDTDNNKYSSMNTEWTRSDDNNDDYTWIGSVGVATEILQIVQQNDNDSPKKEGDSTTSITVVTRGSFRFIVKEIIQTFPFMVAMVDEYIDDDEYKEEDRITIDSAPPTTATTTPLPIQQRLIPQTLYSLKIFVDQILQARPKTLTPLEKSILQDLGNIAPDMISDTAFISFQQGQAEELAALHQVFCSSLLDIAPTEVERYYAVAIMAAEMAQLDDPIFRRDLIVGKESRVRLDRVLQELLQKINLYKERIEKGIELNYFYQGPIPSSTPLLSAESKERSTTSSLKTQEEGNADYNQDLLVGEPTLPSWAKYIKAGTMIEYYWNDEYGWCRGRVVDKPVQILYELIVTVCFDDGETHRLPFRGDEKVRWRPAQ